MRTLLLKLSMLACMASVAILSLQTGFDATPATDPARKPKTAPRVPEGGEPSATISDSEIIETFSRPLFSASRRPFVARDIAPVAAAESQPVEEAQVIARPKRLRLMGINAHGKSFAALIRNIETEEVRWLKQGEVFDGWVLKAANKDQVEFSCSEPLANDCSYKVMLYGNQTHAGE